MNCAHLFGKRKKWTGIFSNNNNETKRVEKTFNMGCACFLNNIHLIRYLLIAVISLHWVIAHEFHDIPQKQPYRQLHMQQSWRYVLYAIWIFKLQ